MRVVCCGVVEAKWKRSDTNREMANMGRRQIYEATKPPDIVILHSVPRAVSLLNREFGKEHCFFGKQSSDITIECSRGTGVCLCPWHEAGVL